ncbi:MAG: DUF1553 domain-containing protein [Planctomycetes bacterium]|nr:DUF1553 domain-containing protein [Planctomycetota bacterium]
MHFGTGLVRTAEDFGSQGERPSHPELLDWLAVEFMGRVESQRPAVSSQRSAVSGQRSVVGGREVTADTRDKSAPRPSTLNSQPLAWDVKRMHRLIVTSATYRQSSDFLVPASNPQPSTLNPQPLATPNPQPLATPNPQPLATPNPQPLSDPENHLLSRGPRFRLSAEMVRDQALFAAGLLVERLGGPSVKPYQPDGLWREIATTTEYEQDHGPALYRRSLYTYWKRTVSPPTMATFDAPSREACTPRRPRTNTPLQALALLNETAFVEAARKLAERALREGGPAPRERLARIFRLVTSRRPAVSDLDLLESGLRQHLETYRHDRTAAEKLLRVGEAPYDPALDPAEMAAYATISGLVLNLDEAVTRE